MTNNTQLPIGVVQEIKISAIKNAAAFIKKTPKRTISRVGLQNICAASYGAGATEWAQWKVKHDEERQQRVHLEKENDVITANYNALKERCDKMEAVLKQFISYHETGLLPDIFTYKKGIEALQGESNTLAHGDGKEVDNGSM